MPIPTLSALQTHVQDGTLRIDSASIPHPAMSELLVLLGATTLDLTSADFDEADGDIEVFGASMFLDEPLSEAVLNLEKDEKHEAGFHFEWGGKLQRVTLKQLVELNVLNGSYLAGLAEFAEVEFPEAMVWFSSHDRALYLEVQGSDIAINAGSIPLSLTKTGFVCALDIEKQQASFALFGTFGVGTSSLAARISLPGTGPRDPVVWIVALDKPFVLNNSLNDVATYLDQFAGVNAAFDGGFAGALPTAIQQLPRFMVSDFELHIDAEHKRMQLLELTLQSDGDFELVPGLTINNVGINPFIMMDGDVPQVTLTLFGAFTLADALQAGLNIQLPLDKTRNWIVTLEGSLDLERLEQLEGLPFLSLSNLNLPPEWLNVQAVLLEYLTLEFNPIQGSITKAAFSLHMKSDSTLIPGISVSNPSLEFELTF